VLAPKPVHTAKLPLAWAVAATIAAVVVVGSVAVNMLDRPPTALVTVNEAGGVRGTRAPLRQVSPDYLLAHQEYSPTTQIQGVGPYLRAVSAGGVDGRP
jgi:sigma-E factor negative regulatory protein RseA